LDRQGCCFIFPKSISMRWRQQVSWYSAFFNGVVFALIAGFVAGWISQRRDLVTGIILALIIAVPALASMVARPGQGALWSQTAALAFMAPASLVGDWIRFKKFLRT
jgi:hypothetical protein